MKFLILSIFYIIFNNLQYHYASESAVKLGVYYDASDKLSIDFISRLTKLPKPVLNITEIDFIPWGTTEYEPNNKDQPFVCDSSDEHCYKKRIHACILSYDDYESALKFIECTVNSDLFQSDPYEGGKLCNSLNKDSLNWEFTNRCASISWYPTYVSKFIQLREKTLKLDPPLQTVPVITINGIQNEYAIYDIKDSICESYNGLKPLECERLTTITSSETETTISEIEGTTIELNPECDINLQ